MAAPSRLDPKTFRTRGIAVHGNTPFDVPLISEILPGLWLGGCKNGVPLPEEIEYVVSLYPWERYAEHAHVCGVVSLTLQDGELTEEALDRLSLAADALAIFRELGPTLVHCQAGLNRSSFVVALHLIRDGFHLPQEAINLIREKRSPACLCNPHFEAWLLSKGELT